MEKCEVLIVDDEQNILNSLERLLHNEPFGVCTTTDSEAALSMIDQGQTKVVISDQRMVTITGVEFLGRVKEKQADIIRILLTGFTDIKVAEDAINCGEVYRLLNKPWNDEDLKGTIRAAVEKYDLVKANKQLLVSLEKKNTELIGFAKKLQNMYEVQKEFSSTVSHELRTPLASIKAAIEIVVSETPGALNLDQKDFLNKAEKHINRLTRLINDILDFSKLDSNAVALELKENDIGEVVKDIVDINRLVAEKKGLYLNVECPGDAPKVMFDFDRLYQVMQNLVGNAIKFTEKGGIVISIVCNEPANYIKVCIADTGGGIRTEDFPKLFQRFQQLGDPAKRQFGGTGLGLAICKKIVEQHNGKIEVESQLGQGTTISFVLPVKERRREGFHE